MLLLPDICYVYFGSPREADQRRPCSTITPEFICPSGTLAGARVLPEAGTFASIPGETPEGKRPGERAAACWEVRRAPVPPQLHAQVSPADVPVPSVHQACVFDRCASFTVLLCVCG